MPSDESTRDTVRVPKVKSIDRVVEWMEIDAEWHEHSQIAEAAKQHATDAYGDHPRVLSIGLTAADDEPRIGENRRFAVTITLLEEGKDPPPELPEEIDGITVRVSTGQPGTPLSDDSNGRDA